MGKDSDRNKRNPTTTSSRKSSTPRESNSTAGKTSIHWGVGRRVSYRRAIFVRTTGTKQVQITEIYMLLVQGN